MVDLDDLASLRKRLAIVTAAMEAAVIEINNVAARMQAAAEPDGEDERATDG
jgi:hypothetical protein